MTQIISIEELMDKQEANGKRMKKQIYQTKDSIIVNVQYRYEIDKSRIDTPEKVIRWAVHLGEKNWMSKELLHFFILTACSAANINPRGV